MKRAILFVVLFGMLFPSASSAIGFGGYYTMSFPIADYDSMGCDPDFGGTNVKAWYDFSDNLALELSSGFRMFQLSHPEGFDEDIGNLRLWNMSIGGKYVVKKFGRFRTYVNGGGGFYRVIIEDNRTHIPENVPKGTYEKPGLYLGGGLKVWLGGPLSAEVNPVLSYVIGVDETSDNEWQDSHLNRIFTFDINVGIAVDF